MFENINQGIKTWKQNIYNELKTGNQVTELVTLFFKTVLF